jgi:hypothetical protein
LRDDDHLDSSRWDAFEPRGDVLTTEDLELYQQAKRRVLPPDCAEWLETGWLGAGPDG